MTIRLTPEGFDSLLTMSQLRLSDIVVGVMNSEEQFVDNNLSGYSVREVISELELEVIPTLNPLSFTVFNVLHETSALPVGLHFRGRFPEFSLPYCRDFDYAELLSQIFQPLMSSEVAFELSDERINEIAFQIHQNGLRHSAMLIASEFNSDNGFRTGDWIACTVARIDSDINDCERLLVITESEDGDQFSVTLMNEPWDALSGGHQPPDWWSFEDELSVQVHSAPSSDCAEFSLIDSEGLLTFRSTQSDAQALISFLTSRGWSYQAGDGSAAADDQGAPNSQVVHSHGTFVEPSVQSAVARFLDGIITGPINAMGFLAIRGIVNGDLNVPNGADVNVQGIVNGTINVCGGTVRLFGTAERVTLNGGRLEVYGIVSSRIERTSGDVYIDPGSIVGD